MLLPLVPACSGDEGPETACRRYLESLAQGDVDSAYELLCAATRNRLEVAVHARRQGRPDPLLPAGWEPDSSESPPERQLYAALLRGGTTPGLPRIPVDPGRRVGSASLGGDHAKVAVSTLTGATEVRLVREQGRWRLSLDLP